MIGDQPPVHGATADGKAGALNPNHLAILERYGGRRGKTVLAGVALAQMAAPFGKKAYDWARRRDDFTITVLGTDAIYPNLHDWVLERIPERERKAMLAQTVGDVYRATVQPAGGPPPDPPKIVLRYDGNRRQKVTVDGHKAEVFVEREAMPNRDFLPDNWRQQTEKITFVASTVAGRDAVVATIAKLLEERAAESSSPALHMPARWGGEWVRRGDLPARTLESVVLKKGQRERLVGDLETFLEAEEEYGRISQPWHRGYLFHGEPGTGKTSVARALANHFGLPTYYLPLGDVEKDVDVMQMVGMIQPRSVLLLEDVDVYNAATSRDETNRAGIGAVLNSLDGVWTPHGLVTILTTNHRDDLDDALLRAGRVDVEEEFTPLDADQVKGLATLIDRKPKRLKDFVGRSPSEMIEELR